MSLMDASAAAVGDAAADDRETGGLVGLFKQLKGAKTALEATPDLLQQAQRLGAQAQDVTAATQSARQSAAPEIAVEVPPPIEDVSLEQFASVCKGLAAHGYDQSKAPHVAAEQGIPGDAWQAAFEGWNARIAADPALARRFNVIYQAS